LVFKVMGLGKGLLICIGLDVEEDESCY